MNNGWVEGIKKKKVVVILLVMILVFPLVWAESSQAAGETYVITPDVGVNLRAEPKQEGATVTKLKQGYRVEVLEESGEWLKVSYEEKQGYVKSEHLKPLDIDLVAAYKHYATVLEETMADSYYSLLYDFTQDGLEELYIVELAENGGFRHRMLSGQKELFDETLTHEGLEIYWDDYNHYIVTNTSEDTGRVEAFELSEIGISSQPGFLRGEMIKTDVNIISSGNLSLSKTAALGEYILVHEGFTGDIENYSVAGKKVTKEQWDKVISGYENAPNYLGLFSYDSRHGDESSPINNDQSSFHETVEKLYALYEEYNDSPIELLLDETKIGEIEQYTNYMLQDPIKDVHNNEIDYYALLNMALYYAMDLGELYDEEGYTYKYPKLKVDEWMYNNFGMKMDNQKLKDHTLRYETEYGTESTKSIEIHDEYYIAPGSGDVGIGNEPYIINSHQLDDDFIALEYVHGYTEALSVLTAEPDYIIVKKVEAANGETYYPYIDTVQNLETIDYDALNKYAEMLDVVKDHKQVESVEEPIDKQNEEALVKESKEQGTTTNSVLYTLVIIGGLVLVVAVVVMNVRKRRSGGKVNKSTTIMMIIFSVIVVGSAIFISINSLQSQTESDTSLGDDTQEDSSSVTDDEQESNDLEDSEVDALKTEIPEVNDEDTVPPVTENTNSTTDENKSNYIASIQYAENLLNDASASGDSIDNLWDAYGAWDDELNRVYGLLKEKLSLQKMEELKIEQRAWIKERDQQANPEVVDSFAEIEILNDLVRERTLYLIDMYFDEE